MTQTTIEPADEGRMKSIIEKHPYIGTAIRHLARDSVASTRAADELKEAQKSGLWGRTKRVADAKKEVTSATIRVSEAIRRLEGEFKVFYPEEVSVLMGTAQRMADAMAKAELGDAGEVKDKALVLSAERSNREFPRLVETGEHTQHVATLSANQAPTAKPAARSMR